MFNNQGSQWRKWDLHVHTPLSLCSDYGGNTKEVWKRFFDKLENLSPYIKVLGINDYLFLDGYKKILEYKQSDGLKNIELLLPVIEFRLKEFVGSKELNRLNYHIIFADSSLLSIEQIESHFLSGLKGKANLNPELPSACTWAGVVSRESLIDLGKAIFNSTPESKKETVNFNPLEIGFNNINFELSKIEQLLGENGEPNIYLKDKYYKAIGKAEWEDFRWDGSPNDKKTVINKSHFVFTASPTIEIAQNGLASLKKQLVNHRLMHCSDAHSFAKEENKTQPKELGHCFTWAKANPTFEGLREIQYEYDLRVHIQETEPNPKIPYEVIKEVRFITNDFSNKIFTTEPIKLNADLNVVIGGKSSGKSLLLYHIANTIDPKQVLKKEDGTDDKKKEDKYAFKKRQIDFEVTWANGTKQLLSQNSNDSITNFSILYIPQAYIQRLADTEGKKTRKEVGKIIREILKQKQEASDDYNQFLTEVKRLDTTRENLISQYVTTLDIYETGLENIKNVGNKDAINAYITELKNQIRELKQNSEVTEAMQIEYDKLRADVQLLNSELHTLKNDRGKTEGFKYNFQNLINELVTLKKQSIAEIQNEEVQTGLEELLKDIELLPDIISKIELGFLHGESGIISKKEKEVNQKIEDNNSRLKPIAEKFNGKEEIERIEQQILDEIAKLDKINSYEAEIQIKKQQNDEAKRKLLDEYRLTFKQYTSIVEKLNARGKEIPELILNGTTKFYTNRFYARLEELINNKQSSWLFDDNILFEEDKDINDIPNINSLTENLEKLFNFVIDDSIVLKKGVTKKDVINALFKDDFFDYWEIKSGNDEIADMSPGKAGLVLLKLLIELSDSKCPILIDQPEDNLDNRSIYSDLVQYIRNKKSLRQFIVVTHNPNIVVGADADNVIVANQNDQDPSRKNANFQFDYISGALEFSFSKKDNPENILTSMGIREHVTEILEGGKEAFQKRESKYRYNNV